MTGRGWRVLILVLVTSIASAGAAMLWANRVAEQSQRQWCGIVATLDDAYRASPPQTPTGRRLAADVAELRRDFHCPPS